MLKKLIVLRLIDVMLRACPKADCNSCYLEAPQQFGYLELECVKDKLNFPLIKIQATGCSMWK